VLEGGGDKRSEIWSIGIILYILLSGEVPFYGESDIIIAERIKVGQYQFECNVSLNHSAYMGDNN
jgi:calcium-dependent protein kinase